MRKSLALAFLLLASPATASGCGVMALYGPSDNLEAMDVSIINGARERIDLAAYVLTSIPVIDALSHAARSGVVIRIYRDGRLAREPRALAEAMERLRSEQNVEIRYKAAPAPLMHLKAYAVDGELLREGSANFTHSGLLRQDNSLLALLCPDAVTAFEKAFNAMWRR